MDKKPHIDLMFMRNYVRCKRNFNQSNKFSVIGVDEGVFI